MTDHSLDKILAHRDLDGFIAYLDQAKYVQARRDAIKRLRLAFQDDPELIY